MTKTYLGVVVALIVVAVVSVGSVTPAYAAEYCVGVLERSTGQKQYFWVEAKSLNLALQRVRRQFPSGSGYDVISGTSGNCR